MGPYLNHQFLVAAQPPLLSTTSTIPHAVLDGAGMVQDLPALQVDVPGRRTTRSPRPAALPTTVAGSPAVTGASTPRCRRPSRRRAYGPKIPLIDDTNSTSPSATGMSDAGVSWAWYSGGWDNAAGNVGGRGYTNGTGPTCADPNSAPASRTTRRCERGAPYCPNSRSSSTTSRSPTSRGTPRARRTGQAPQGRAGLPRPGPDRHPAEGELRQADRRSRTSTPATPASPNGSDHLVELHQGDRARAGGKNTLVVVTYDEFGGQWDHVSPPGDGHDRGARPVRPRHPHPGADRRRPVCVRPASTTSLRHDVDHGDDRAGGTASSRSTTRRHRPRDGRVAPLTHAVNLGLTKKSPTSTAWVGRAPTTGVDSLWAVPSPAVGVRCEAVGRDHRCGHRRRRRRRASPRPWSGRRGCAERLFTDAEQPLPPASLAARFAAKEALAKALGAPVGLRWRDAEVHRGDDGRPHLEHAGHRRGRADELGVRATHLSLSHDAGIASAVVVAEG